MGCLIRWLLLVGCVVKFVWLAYLLVFVDLGGVMCLMVVMLIVLVLDFLLMLCIRVIACLLVCLNVYCC